MPHDVYEEEDAGIEAKFNRKFSHVDTNVRVGLPDDFEDESIDEDEAFNAEDFERFGDLNFGQNKRKVCFIFPFQIERSVTDFITLMIVILLADPLA